MGDLYHWKNEGTALAVDERRGSEITKGCIIERPKVIHNARTKTFVMWFHLEHRGAGYGTARCAVATSRSITGPYRFIESHRPNHGEWPQNYARRKTDDRWIDYLKRDRRRGQMSRDMTVFVDDDQKAYLISSAEENYTLNISLLTDDYLDFTGKFWRIFPGGHNEAPAICKHDGRYWLITSGCTGWDPNEARSFVADSMEGPWKALGNPCTGPNGAGGMGPEKTWGGQSTFILPIHGKPGQFIAMFDVWRPKDPIDGRYLWLPVDFEDERIKIVRPKTWTLGDLDLLSEAGSD
ncbi:glycoside hydrolase family 43 protein [Haloferula sargassicola]|uniref:glycoside hydrolase family 43 protein n=1 Tax=Haloferula sargassicola TaxID=490096 RepID=UPI0033657E8C